MPVTDDLHATDVAHEATARTVPAPQASAGSVGTRRLRSELEARGLEDVGSLIACLKFSGAASDGTQAAFYHHGRSFYSPEAFQRLAVEVDADAPAVEDGEAAGAAEHRPRHGRRQEEARLVRYVREHLENVYASDVGPEAAPYVFDVHNQRPGSDFENIDLLAVHWRLEEVVETVAVEVKLTFNAKLVQQANNYRRFADRVWMAIPVDAQLVDAAEQLREEDPRLFEHVVDAGLGILACRRSPGRSYQVAPIHWPRRSQPDPVERAEFLGRFRETFEAAKAIGPRDRHVFPRLG